MVSGPALSHPIVGLPALPGPNLTPAERRLDGAISPVNASGTKLCWNFNTHVGCSEGQFPWAHEYVKNFEASAHRVKMVFAKRYGFKKRGKPTEAKANEAIRAMRREVSTDLTARRQAPGVRGDSGPIAHPASRLSCGLDFDPNALTEIDYVLD